MRTQQQKGYHCLFSKAAVRLQKTKPFSGLGVKEISRAPVLFGFFFKM